MAQFQAEKLLKTLEYFLSLHEADKVMEMILHPSRAIEDIISYLDAIKDVEDTEDI